MKKLQRILMALALCSLSIGAVGCQEDWRIFEIGKEFEVKSGKQIKC